LVLSPQTEEPLEDFRPPVYRGVCFLTNEGKSFSRVAQTGNTRVKIINECTEDTKKIRLKAGKRFPIKKLDTCLGFEVPTAVVIKSYISWDITLCSPLKVNRRFGGTCHLHLLA
jgi:hypothetical protein